MKNYHGEYMGTLEEYARIGGYKPQAFNPFDPKGLMKTEKTTRACRNCRGEGWHYVIHQNFGKLVTRQYCTGCRGTGVVFG